MGSFERTFPTAEDVAAFILDTAHSGERAVLKFSLAASIDAPTRREELDPQTRFFQVTQGAWGDWYRFNEVAGLLLPASELARFTNDKDTGLGESSMNGSACQETTYATNTERIKLVLIRWAEWWQPFGGGSVGGYDVLWLVNRNRL